MLNVGTRNVGRAKAVQKHGDPELIKQVERGELSVNQAAKKVTAGKTPEATKKKGKPKGRDRGHERARLWTKLRDALESINGMPEVTTVVMSVPASQREVVTKRLPIVRKWLDELQTEWSKKQEGKDASTSSTTKENTGSDVGNGPVDAENGNGIVGAQHP